MPHQCPDTGRGSKSAQKGVCSTRRSLLSPNIQINPPCATARKSGPCKSASRAAAWTGHRDHKAHRQVAGPGIVDSMMCPIEMKRAVLSNTCKTSITLRGRASTSSCRPASQTVGMHQAWLSRFETARRSRQSLQQ